MSSGAHNVRKTDFDLYSGFQTKSSTAHEESPMKNDLKHVQTIRGTGLMRGIWLSAGFLCLGLMTACSEVRNEVVANKQSTSESQSKKFGTID